MFSWLVYEFQETIPRSLPCQQSFGWFNHFFKIPSLIQLIYFNTRVGTSCARNCYTQLESVWGPQYVMQKNAESSLNNNHQTAALSMANSRDLLSLTGDANTKRICSNKLRSIYTGSWSGTGIRLQPNLSRSFLLCSLIWCGKFYARQMSDIIWLACHFKLLY